MDPKRIGAAIKKLRTSAGYTQMDLAKRLDVSDKAVSKWERGIGVPDISLIRRLSIVLDTDIDSLLEGNVHFNEKLWKGLLILDDFANKIIYDKTVFECMISYFLLVGVRDIVVFGSQDYLNDIQTNFGDGDRYGISISYRTYEIGKNLKEAIVEYKDIFAFSSVMVMWGSFFLYGTNLTRFILKALARDNDFSILAFVNNKSPNEICLNSDQFATNDKDSAVRTRYRYAYLPILFCRAGIAKLSEYKFHNMDELVNTLICGKLLAVEVMDRGFINFDIASNDDLLDAATFMKLITMYNNMQVNSMEEILYARGILPLREKEVCSM